MQQAPYTPQKTTVMDDHQLMLHIVQRSKENREIEAKKWVKKKSQVNPTLPQELSSRQILFRFSNALIAI